MSNEEDFAGRNLPMALGTVKGVRSFDVDDRGRLMGVYYHVPWRPGENLAKCTVTKGQKSGKPPSNAIVVSSIGGTQYVQMPDGTVRAYSGIPTNNTNIIPPTWLVGGGGYHTADVQKMFEPDHGLDGCGHGFYGYYDGSNDYKTNERVSAVVEGYGETVIGTRGFRSTKAKILALCIPQVAPHKKSLAQWLLPWKGTAKRYAIWNELLGALFGIFAIASLIIGIVTLTYGSLWGLISLLVGFPLWGWNSVSMFSRDGTLKAWPKPVDTDDKYAKIRELYPDIPIFEDFHKMIVEYPPDRSLGLSPVDDEFWEMR